MTPTISREFKALAAAAARADAKRLDAQHRADEARAKRTAAARLERQIRETA
jgi:hypothetical protein